MLDSLHYEDFAEAASVGKPLNIHLGPCNGAQAFLKNSDLRLSPTTGPTFCMNGASRTTL